MSALSCLLLITFFGFNFALPPKTILMPDLKITSSNSSNLENLGVTVDDVRSAARYDPETANAYHLFTRENPTVSQPLVLNGGSILQQSNFNRLRKTIFIVHGWRDSASSELTSVLVPALLEAKDVNIIVVDWSSGASSPSYRVVIYNTINSARAVANFIGWLSNASGSTNDQYHLIGHGVGGHQVGIIGRNLRGTVSYITGLDPALIGWVNNIYRFQPDDGVYTEVIHTNYGVNGYLGDLAQVDFYPNGGISMPGCDSNECDHARSYYYFAESVKSGGFTGRQCLNYYAAVLGMCNELPGRLHMGGLEPKYGRTGVFLLETNAGPPFSQG